MPAAALTRDNTRMLAQVLPGLRHLRAPLVSGALWLLVAWVLIGERIPSKTAATGLIARLYVLAEQLGKPVVLGAIGLTAYMVGGLAIALEHWIRRSSSTRAFAVEVLDTFAAEIDRVKHGDATLPSMSRRLKRWTLGRIPWRAGPDGPEDWLRENPDIRMWAHVHAARYALRDDIKIAEIRWPVDVPDLFNEYDRRNSELEFNRGVAFPLAGLALALAVTDRTAIVAAFSFAMAVLAVACLMRSAAQRRELSFFVLAAQTTGRIELPVLSALAERWVHDVGPSRLPKTMWIVFPDLIRRISEPALQDVDDVGSLSQEAEISDRSTARHIPSPAVQDGLDGARRQETP